MESQKKYSQTIASSINLNASALHVEYLRLLLCPPLHNTLILVTVETIQPHSDIHAALLCEKR